MSAAASSDGISCVSLAISSAERAASSAAPAFGPELAERLHREPAVALDEQGERRLAVLVGQLAEDLREVGGVLLLEQVEQVRRRTDAQQALDRVEDEIDSSLRRHGEASVTVTLNLARDSETSDDMLRIPTGSASRAVTR